uniref:hypothetical protein n=1 Tax=Natronorubrum daqingense TaxID=588898 RepID=UPI00373FE30E
MSGTPSRLCPGEIGGFFGPMRIGVLHDARGSFVPGLALLAAGTLVVVFARAGLQYLDD